jgi:hypothetical protein
MAQATNLSTTSHLHNLSPEQLADLVGEADGAKKASEARLAELKGELQRRTSPRLPASILPSAFALRFRPASTLRPSERFSAMPSRSSKPTQSRQSCASKPCTGSSRRRPSNHIGTYNAPAACGRRFPYSKPRGCNHERLRWKTDR